MYTDHWGLRESPFRALLDPRFYFNSPSHDEGLARLQFLVDNQRRLGLVLGPSGSGKSLLLEVFARQLRTQGKQVAVVGLLGLDGQEFMGQLAYAIGENVDASASVGRMWRSVTDRFLINRYQHVDTVILLDDADEAESSVLTLITRLVQWEPSPEARLTIVLAARAERLAHLGQRLLELCELRIDLVPWDYEDTAEYLRSSLAKVGRNAPTFDVQAIARLHQLSSGIPRRVRQVAEMALLAGAGRELNQIDSRTIDTVNHELLLAGQTSVSS